METTTVFKSISIQTFSNHFHPILKGAHITRRVTCKYKILANQHFEII